MDQVYPKRIFPVEKSKIIDHHWILHIPINWVPNFNVNWKFWFFRLNLSKKVIFDWKRKRWASPLHFAYSNYSEYHILLHTNSFEFWGQICTKRVFSVENEKIEHHYWILHIRISLRIRFYFKQTILIFQTKFAQKRVFLF